MERAKDIILNLIISMLRFLTRHRSPFWQTRKLGTPLPNSYTIVICESYQSLQGLRLVMLEQLNSHWKLQLCRRIAIDCKFCVH